MLALTRLKALPAELVDLESGAQIKGLIF